MRAAISAVSSCMSIDGRTEPDVLGPIGGVRPPWGVPCVDPAAWGYTVEDHLRGIAGCYEVVSDDPDAKVEEGGTAPYSTRLLVLRPVDPQRFNHTVLLNWQNVSAGYEQPAPSEGELYQGYVWVGVSAHSRCSSGELWMP
jgi:hypothetical protein